MKTLRIFLIILIFGLCISDSFALPKKLIGMWTAAGTCEFISMQFCADGTFTADQGLDRVNSNHEGTYEVHGKTITLNINNDPRMPAYVPQKKLRNYKVKGNVLTFTMNGKKCKFNRSM